MKQLRISSILLILIAGYVFTSCETEDPGPLQVYEKEFSLIDFDRLEMGSAFHVQVARANNFSIRVKGDRRNIDDLSVYRTGSTLVIKFDKQANRSHETYITIAMPQLTAINFSGASVSDITGFEGEDQFDLYLSGASVCQLDADYNKVNVVVSGASSLRIAGEGSQLEGEISGASVLRAFDFPVDAASISISGASQAKVNVAATLDVVATGASALVYRGNPSVTANVSGASSVQTE